MLRHYAEETDFATHDVSLACRRELLLFSASVRFCFTLQCLKRHCMGQNELAHSFGMGRKCLHIMYDCGRKDHGQSGRLTCEEISTKRSTKQPRFTLKISLVCGK